MREAEVAHGVIGILSRNVLIHLDLRQTDIDHTDLLTLIYERSAALADIHRCEHLAALDSVFKAAVSVYDTRLIVVLDIECIPCLAVQLCLPVVIDILELSEAERRSYPAVEQAVRLHMLEVEHHIELLILVLLDEFHRGLGSHHGCLADCHAVVFIEHLSELAEIFLKMRSALVMLNTRSNRQRESVRQTLGFGYKCDNILSEAVNAHVEPEAHDVFYLFANLGVIHIEVGLTLGKEMEIILIEIFVIFPCGTRESRKPVVRRLLAALFAVAPKIIVMIGVILALHALKEPLMLI